MMYVSANQKAVSLNLHRYTMGCDFGYCTNGGAVQLLHSVS
jgi:hypothetical protein